MGPIIKGQAVQEEFHTTNQCVVLYEKVLTVDFSRGSRVSQVAGVCSGYQGVGVRNGRHQSNELGAGIGEVKNEEMRRSVRVGGTTVKVENE